MSTDSMIGILDEGTITFVTCHNGGGKYMADRLSQNYGSVDLVEELIALGDLSSVGTTVALKDGTSAYKRDWNRPFRPQKMVTVAKFLELVRDVRWGFVFDVEENRWYYCAAGDFRLHSVECPGYLFRE